MLKGVILNTGNIDIDSNIVFEPLKMILPQNYSWLEFRIGKKSDNLNISSEKIKNNIIKINWDLFKKNEFFSFNSLILTDGKKESREEITKIINFSYRITNLNEIKKRNAESIINKKNWYSDYILPLIGILFFLIIGIITLLRPTIDSYKINEDKIKYILREEEGIKNVSFYIGKNNELIVKDKNGDVYIKGKPSDILKDYNIEPTFNIDYKKNQIVNKVIGISFVVLFLPLFVFVFINMLQDRKIYYYYYKQNND
ncbi:hypothetical protein KAI52_04410 [Candidatus Parcubacteria bacterium]|nr:hypothetical protein [Candidatus Parcubacteria bacterium]